MTPEDYGIRGLRPCGRILAYQAPADYNLGLKTKYFRHFSEEAARFILS